MIKNILRNYLLKSIKTKQGKTHLDMSCLKLKFEKKNFFYTKEITNIDDLKDYFSPYRSYPINSGLQTILGTKLSFALSNLITLKF